jgi:hypothetical protein
MFGVERIKAGSHLQEACMSTVDDDTAEAIVTFVSGAIIGVFATLLIIRAQRKRVFCTNENDDDYYYDGGDLFV